MQKSKTETISEIPTLIFYLVYQKGSVVAKLSIAPPGLAPSKFFMPSINAKPKRVTYHEVDPPSIQSQKSQGL